MNKQAILIMYHNDYYVLEKLLKQIDLKYFDIYLHIDKKVSKDEYKLIREKFDNENIYFVKRLNVKWSTYSQIKCELNLFSVASKKKYQYYHLISGNDLLIKSSKEIYNFFRTRHEEFVGYVSFNDITSDLCNRIKYYHFLNGNKRHKNNFIRKISEKIYYNSLKIQKILRINRLSKSNLEIRKGANWCSITHELVAYILNNKKLIHKMFKFSNCADELFIQTLVYNSKFKDKIYNKYNDEHKNIFRFIDWNRGEPYVFRIDDYDELVNSPCFFARKFSSNVDSQIINKIFNK